MGYPKSKRCPTCQATVNRIRDAQHKKTGPARKIGSTDKCEQCGKEYIVNSGLQRYCPDCSAAAVAHNIRKHKREYQQERSAAYGAAKKANHSYNKICVVCGTVFDTDTATVTCSEECAQKLKRMRWAIYDYKRGRRSDQPPEPDGIKKYKESKANDK